MKKKAVVLTSGGLDSTTVAAVAKNEGYELYCLSFNYGQRHLQELESAKRVAEYFGAKKHLIIDIDLKIIGGSALTSDIEVPKHREEKEMITKIPITYVPARNTIFLSYALAFAEVLQSNDLFIGVNAIDYSGYPDCRPEYIEAFEKMANLATKVGVEGITKLKIHAPLQNLSKKGIIELGLSLGVDYSITHSCYDPLPDGTSCGECDSCLLRKHGFEQAGVEDPLHYAK
ncbi:MAG: 7-cyano-7-deazaguanine synthase QueC [Ignavibacteriales bacterium]|jgi:preQ(0) biosynthesis protein QueC|nr:MAG: 7-cyano-7-deazaguanine synthase QueC [Ignavibacteriaceae bacterium]MBW7872212.1 7-cyano-7-deazaguanine synthase QueC [Ignavibacteria bacterium]MCZ2144025.1 7-cyano-7-deazaguanine synthase QueC [Ignavibacteriales bacterium]OQY70479.1 MAG: 7-cyano-7-deazaguanine synthase QueC [Ignavibacteriales bacterium UTCHB3]MBV6445642.1 7-cyano-7-deazaguanine synthase [Ignavibacteriaceae bacterium]